MLPAVQIVRRLESIAFYFTSSNLARSPLLGKERFERAVETQDREPALFRIGLNPRAHAVRLGRPEI